MGAIAKKFCFLCPPYTFVGRFIKCLQILWSNMKAQAEGDSSNTYKCPCQTGFLSVSRKDFCSVVALVTSLQGDPPEQMLDEERREEGKLCCKKRINSLIFIGISHALSQFFSHSSLFPVTLSSQNNLWAVLTSNISIFYQKGLLSFLFLMAEGKVEGNLL